MWNIDKMVKLLADHESELVSLEEWHASVVGAGSAASKAEAEEEKRRQEQAENERIAREAAEAKANSDKTEHRETCTQLAASKSTPGEKADVTGPVAQLVTRQRHNNTNVVYSHPGWAYFKDPERPKRNKIAQGVLTFALSQAEAAAKEGRTLEVKWPETAGDYTFLVMERMHSIPISIERLPLTCVANGYRPRDLDGIAIPEKYGGTWKCQYFLCYADALTELGCEDPDCPGSHENLRPEQLMPICASGHSDWVRQYIASYQGRKESKKVIQTGRGVPHPPAEPTTQEGRNMLKEWQAAHKALLGSLQSQPIYGEGVLTAGRGRGRGRVVEGDGDGDGGRGGRGGGRGAVANPPSTGMMASKFAYDPDFVP
ncbi:hypothetical protein CC80DRAFT_575540 [Byssothecium circinans]|uniref:Uncharacterized protein n=1 Tax=Byssothecium circinans TaxID=147558 RepID=A0A6A5TFM6_9PLEO|nr:hypothetical protein CC80DRAFT_575540 [Byssothecium circinans]